MSNKDTLDRRCIDVVVESMCPGRGVGWRTDGRIESQGLEYIGRGMESVGQVSRERRAVYMLSLTPYLSLDAARMVKGECESCSGILTLARTKHDRLAAARDRYAATGILRIARRAPKYTAFSHKTVG